MSADLTKESIGSQMNQNQVYVVLQKSFLLLQDGLLAAPKCATKWLDPTTSLPLSPGCSRPVPESVREDADASYISFTAGDLYDEGSARSQERRGPVRPRAVAPPKPPRHFHYQQHHNPGQRSNTGFPSNWNASRDPFFRRHLAAQSASRTRR